MRISILFTRLVLCALLLIVATSFSFGYSRAPQPKALDASNLRQIGQASLIYAQDNRAQLPRAADIWDYAELLAYDGGLELTSLWQSRVDPATDRDVFPGDGKILLPSSDSRSRERNPDFRKLKPSFAVPIGKLNDTMPAKTPLAWTRGLQLDGTWAAHSPYGPTGGHIVFLDTTVVFFRNLTDGGGQLTRFDGQGRTANILEALPPGTRIGEYIPSDTERIKWTRLGNELAQKDQWRRRTPLLIASVIWINVVVITAFLFKRNIVGATTLIIVIMLLTVIILFTAFGLIDLPQLHY